MESKNERIAEILQKKLIVIVRGLPRQQLRKTAQALYDGGIRFLEITYSASGAVTDGQTAGKHRYAYRCFRHKYAHRCRDGSHRGAGAFDPRSRAANLSYRRIRMKP